MPDLFMLSNQFPTPTGLPSLPQSIFISVFEGVDFLSRLVSVADCLKPLTSSEDYMRMDVVPSEFLAIERAHFVAKVSENVPCSRGTYAST